MTFHCDDKENPVLQIVLKTNNSVNLSYLYGNKEKTGYYLFHQILVYIEQNVTDLYNLPIEII